MTPGSLQFWMKHSFCSSAHEVRYLSCTLIFHVFALTLLYHCPELLNLGSQGKTFNQLRLCFLAESLEATSFRLHYGCLVERLVPGNDTPASPLPSALSSQLPSGVADPSMEYQLSATSSWSSPCPFLVARAIFFVVSSPWVSSVPALAALSGQVAAAAAGGG